MHCGRARLDPYRFVEEPRSRVASEDLLPDCCRLDERLEGENLRLRKVSPCAERELAAIRADVHDRIDVQASEDVVVLCRCGNSCGQESSAVGRDPEDLQELAKNVQDHGCLSERGMKK
jgi:hypothetical protein